MGTATSKNTKAKAIPVTTIKSKKVIKPITKKEYVEPVRTAKSSSTKPVSKQKALTKEDLEKRQKSKGTSRKQGGKKFSALKADQLKTMAHILEAAPTKVD